MNKPFFLSRIISLFFILIVGLGVLYILLKLFPEYQAMGYSSLSFGVERQKELQQIYHNDNPILVQYINWIKNAFTLNFGHSTSTGKSVNSIIRTALTPTLALSFLSLIWATLISIPLAVVSAQKKTKAPDNIISSIMIIFYSFPSYWIGLMLLYFFSIKFNIFPSSQIQSIYPGNPSFWISFSNYIYHLFLPSLALGIGYASYFYKFLRLKLIEILDSDYLAAAKARGLNKQILFIYYILPNIMILMLTLIGTITPAIIGGTVTVEYIFSIPGLGKTMVNAALSRDIPLIMGISSISFFFVLFMNISIDFLIKILNPQTRSISYD